MYIIVGRSVGRGISTRWCRIRRVGRGIATRVGEEYLMSLVKELVLRLLFKEVVLRLLFKEVVLRLLFKEVVLRLLIKEVVPRLLVKDFRQDITSRNHVITSRLSNDFQDLQEITPKLSNHFMIDSEYELILSMDYLML
jgi:hypothetical protein